jgi:hypothetical protein
LIIEPDIGKVGLNGVLLASPTRTTAYSITATGPGGIAKAFAKIVVQEPNPISLEIISPPDGFFVSRPIVTVSGALNHAKAVETGLTVNGVLAIVSGNQFIANHVPLVQGENIITALATDAFGRTKTDSIIVNADMSKDYILVNAEPISGTPPFETTLRIDGTFDIKTSQIIHEGPDAVEILERTHDTYQVRLNSEGIYTFRVEATDVQGHSFTDEIWVEVLDREELDALLRAKWENMKTSLIDGDIPGALKYHQDHSSESYAAIYNALGGDLSMLVRQMQEISAIFFEGSRAKYRIRQDHDVEGQLVAITYYIYFSRDENGIWKIDKY